MRVLNYSILYVTMYKPLRSVAGNLFMNTISIENENRRSTTRPDGWQVRETYIGNTVAWENI